MSMTQPAYAYPASLSASLNPDEDWTKISDLVTRRRIQNRLAQRNYRKKVKRRLDDLERLTGSSEDVATDKQPQKTTKWKQHSFAPQSKRSRPTVAGMPDVCQGQFTSPVRPTGEPLFADTCGDRVRSNSLPHQSSTAHSAPDEMLLPLHDSDQPCRGIAIVDNYATNMMDSASPVQHYLATHASDAINSWGYLDDDGFNPCVAYGNMTPKELNAINLYEQFDCHIPSTFHCSDQPIAISQTGHDSLFPRGNG
ncbi:hypothetical protein FPRO04_14409 [Fusarium proliferatum]|nr:hypothetical protein FPRO04_14409 [Fusarium proliferatum]